MWRKGLRIWMRIGSSPEVKRAEVVHVGDDIVGFKIYLPSGKFTLKYYIKDKVDSVETW